MLMLALTRKTIVPSFAAEFTIRADKMSISGLLVLIGFIQTVSTEEAISAIACSSDNILKLVCPKGYTIDILSVVYGEKEATYCNYYKEDISYCEAEKAITIVKDICNWKEICILKAFTDLFGDPCAGSEYLEVVYQCLKNYNILTSITCQFHEFHIECPREEEIKIVNAWYGYENPLFCNHYEPKNENKCGSDNAREVLSKRCDNENTCNMMVDRTTLDDPCPSSYKYLQTDYLCLSRSFHPFRKIVCENETMLLSCPRGEVINIMTAIFGKKDPRLCNQPGMKVTNCEAGGTLQYVKYVCELRQSCFLSDFVNIVGDPCLGVWKYLDVTYKCVKANVKRIYACEFENLTIDCGSDYIRLSKAVYGRDDALYCNKKEYQIFTNHCGNTSSFEVVRKRCDNQNQCNIGALNEEFGNPCPDTYKYLDVDYLCKSYKHEFHDEL